MVSEHLDAHLSESQRARFVELLCKSANDVGLPADAEFRATSMAFAFDLWSHENVAKHAAAILGRLEAGSMPCDGPPF